MSAANPNSNSYDSGIITYTSRGKARQSAGSTSAKRYDFLDFLGVAQSMRIDFLPILWQPALIGKGGTAEIRQGIVYIEKTFAFKQMKKAQSPMEDAQCLCALIAEVSILNRYEISRHKNIVNIEGICWDVEPGGEKVWPVLVFEKAPYGDLNKFMTFGVGEELDIEKRLGVLIDVALAIRDMHLVGVIHGDIKPENVLIFPKILDFEKWGPAVRKSIKPHSVLIFPKEEGCYVAKVTDFGYSTLFKNENASVRMPKSKYWTAPEWHEREFLPIEARRMDSYSFGMLCLWLLFYNNNSSADRDFEMDIGDASMEVLDHALGLVETITCPGLQQRENIQRLLSLTLAQDPRERTSDFGEILQLLLPNMTPTSKKPTKSISIPQKNFQVDLSLPQLIEAHFEVRNYIVKCLKEKYDCCSATPYAKLELGFCYELGFGIDRDSVRSQSLLEESGMEPSSLEGMIERVKEVDTVFTFTGTQFGQFGALHFEGFIPAFNPSQQYREQKQSNAAESQYRKEIQTFGYLLGDTNVLVQKLRHQLAFLLDSEGRWKDAEKVQLELIDFAKEATNRISLPFTSDLTRSYWKQGRYTEAEELARWSVEASKNTWGEEDPQTQANNQLLVSVLYSQGKWREATEIGEKSVQFLRRMMGENHPDTIASLENQALHVPRDDVREQRLRQTLSLWSSAVGKDHPNTLTNMDHLAEVLCAKGKVEESKIMHQQAYRLRKTHLGEEHPDTLKSMSNLAWVANNEGKYEQAEEIQQKALELTKVNFGRDHPEILRRLIEQAYLRIWAGKFDKGKELHPQITTEWELGAEHLDLLESIENVGKALMEKGRYEEAEQVYRRAFMLKEKVFGKETFHVTRSMELLGTLFNRQAKYEEAEKIFRQTSAIRESILGKDNYYTALSLCGLANVLQSQKRYGEAQEIARRTPGLI